MTLQDVSDALLPSFPPSVQKDVKTAVRMLAQALQCSDPQRCQLEQFHQPLPSLYRRLEAFLMAQGKSAHTVRNTKNHISRLFRLAAEHHLFSLVPLPPTPQYAIDTRPLRTGFANAKAAYLRAQCWPPDLLQAFTDFAIWATDPVVPGRPASLRKRQQTIDSYRHAFEGYFGYLANIRHVPVLTFDQLFDIDLVTAFVHWHINDLHHRPTIQIRIFLTHLLALTRQYHPLPDFRARLLSLKKTIPEPAPFYNKDEAWVSLATLKEVARAIWPRKHPSELRQDSTNPGRRTASHAGVSLMLQLWTYIPLRQRNIREMQLGTNLLKDEHGNWRLVFRGEQLKVASKRGRENIFTLPFPPTLTPVLEDYLTLWRPVLLAFASTPSSHVFLTRYGMPMTSRDVRRLTSDNVYRYTGKHWHPHIIRTVWATEMIRQGLSLLDVAKMLNDRFETVIANYSHLLEEDAAEKAYRLIEQHLSQGK